MRAVLRVTIAVLLGTAVLLTTTACGPAHIEVRSYNGLPERTTGIDTSVTDGKPGAAWQGDGAQLAIVTWGSSSCLPYVNTIAVGGGNSLTVDIQDAGGVCTADFGPRTTIINVPSAIDRSRETHLTLRPKGDPVTVQPLS